MYTRVRTIGNIKNVKNKNDGNIVTFFDENDQAIKFLIFLFRNIRWSEHLSLNKVYPNSIAKMIKPKKLKK